MLELDHVFAIVTAPDLAAARLEADGWILDAGQAHPGQGTRNRRLRWRGFFVELVWITDPDEASRNVLRLDRRAPSTTPEASPFGIAFRGLLPAELIDEYWLYDALGPRIWIHRDNEAAPGRTMVLVLETGGHQMQRRRDLLGADAVAPQPAGDLEEVRLHGPAGPVLPSYAGPPVIHEPGPHRMELVVNRDGFPLQISAELTIRR